jgi:Winged helix DNA-binding domain
MDVTERRTRLGRRHHLTPAARAATALDVARGMVALHATDPATVYLSILARASVAVTDIERALYEEKVLMRMLGMRRTMFVVPIEFAPVVQAACTRAIAAQERRRTIQLFGQAGLADDIASWLGVIEEQTFDALGKRGKATAQQLSEDLPELKRQVRIASEKSYAGAIGVSSRVLFQLSADGRIVRGRPRGSWISGQYHWSPMEEWIPGGLAEILVPTAQTSLTRAWLGCFGPGTLADLTWWTGLRLGEVRRALQDLSAVEVDLGGASGWVLPDDLAPEVACEPWVSLLPGLDPTPMGFVDRTWFLGRYAPAIFDRTGNIGPSVWWDGRIVGGWAQRKNGAIAYKLLEDVGAEAERAVESAANDLGRWLGSVRVTPRFRTPLERELSA